MAGSPHAWHHDAVVRAGAQRLARIVTPYRVLTRDDLAALADVEEWRDADFEAALNARSTSVCSAGSATTCTKSPGRR
jgi:hypothetical protein